MTITISEQSWTVTTDDDGNVQVVSIGTQGPVGPAGPAGTNLPDPAGHNGKFVGIAGNVYTLVDGSGGASWGGITGTLSAQTDLQNSLNLKAPLASPTFTGEATFNTDAVVLYSDGGADFAAGGLHIGSDGTVNNVNISNPATPATLTLGAGKTFTVINTITFSGTDSTTMTLPGVSSSLAPLASPGFTGTPTGPTASTSTNSTQLATTAFAQSLVTQSVAGLWDDRGNYDASVNTFPASGGSGTAGAILKGDIWTISVAGTLGSVAVRAGDTVRAIADTPGQTAGNWSTAEHNLGYLPLNPANNLSEVASTTTALTNLGGTGVGVNLFKLANPSAVTFVRVNADNSVSTLSASSMLSALGGQTAITFGTGVQTALGVNIGSAGAPVLFNGAGGKPSSIDLTNGTALPISGLTASTSTAIGVGSIELGHATDATISRVSAGVIAVEGVTVYTQNGALGTPTSGRLGNCTQDGTNAVGFLGIPQNSKSADYTTVLSDAGKHLYHPSADTTARTWTIDGNANVAYPVNTTLTFINDTSGGAITIAITSDTLVLAGTGSTGSRTLAANGIATAVKVTSTRWIINGTGLT